jgi:hypothetical protein
METRRVFEVCGKIRVAGKGKHAAKLKAHGRGSNPQHIIRVNRTSRPTPEGKSPLGRALNGTFTALGLLSNTRRVQYDQSQSIETTR